MRRSLSASNLDILRQLDDAAVEDATPVTKPTKPVVRVPPKALNIGGQPPAASAAPETPTHKPRTPVAAPPRSAVKETGSAMKPGAILVAEEPLSHGGSGTEHGPVSAHANASATGHNKHSKAHPSKLPITASKLSANKAAKQLAIEKAKHPHQASHPAVPARYLAPTQAAEARKKDIKNSHIPITSSATNDHGQRKGSRIPSAATRPGQTKPTTTNHPPHPQAAVTHGGVHPETSHEDRRNEEILRAVEACEQVANDAVDVALHHHRQQQHHHSSPSRSQGAVAPPPAPLSSPGSMTVSMTTSSSSLLVSSPLQVDTAMMLSSSSMLLSSSVPLTRMESLDRRINLSRSGAISPVMGQVEEMDNVSFQESIDCKCYCFCYYCVRCARLVLHRFSLCASVCVIYDLQCRLNRISCVKAWTSPCPRLMHRLLHLHRCLCHLAERYRCN